MKLKDAEKELAKMPVAMQLLVDPESLKQHINSISKTDKGKIIAYLCSSMKMSDVARMLDITYEKVRYYSDKNQDICDYAKVARASVLIELCQRKAVDMLRTFEPEEIPQEKRPQAIKFLVETADKAAYMAKIDDPEIDTRRTKTSELIFRVTERMVGNPEPKVIDHEVQEGEIVDEPDAG